MTTAGQDRAKGPNAASTYLGGTHLGDAHLDGTHLDYARPDIDRLARTGDPETVFGQSKSASQIVELLTNLHVAHPERAVLATRCAPDALAACRAAFGSDATVDELGRTVVVGPLPKPTGSVAVVAAGTTDLAVAAEAMISVSVYGCRPYLIADVGVAGLHRLLAERDRITEANAVIAIAGMEGALPSVLAGLIGIPIIAVPTSIGYGASFEGLAALLAMLNSCAPGVAVVNIDNGYGAAVVAARIARAAR